MCRIFKNVQKSSFKLSEGSAQQGCGSWIKPIWVKNQLIKWCFSNRLWHPELAYWEPQGRRYSTRRFTTYRSKPLFLAKRAKDFRTTSAGESKTQTNVKRSQVSNRLKQDFHIHDHPRFKAPNGARNCVSKQSFEPAIRDGAAFQRDPVRKNGHPRLQWLDLIKNRQNWSFCGKRCLTHQTWSSSNAIPELRRKYFRSRLLRAWLISKLLFGSGRTRISLRGWIEWAFSLRVSSSRSKWNHLNLADWLWGRRRQAEPRK